MLRLFLIVYALIVATLVAVVVSINLFSNVLMERVETDSYDTMYSPAFTLLDDAVNGLQGRALDERLHELRASFKYPIDLVPSSSIELTDRQSQKLSKAGVIGKTIDGAHTLFSQSVFDGMLWSYLANFNEYENEVAVATGPLNLLKNKLQDMTLEQQQSALEDFSQQTGYQFETGPPEQFHLNDDEQSRLHKKLVVVRYPGKPGEQFFIQLDNSGTTLQITVAGYPWYAAYLMPLIYACALLSLALFSMVWLWPLWRDLRSLKQASSAIALGKLDARANAGRRSMIKTVLQGFNGMAESSQKMINSQKELTDAVSHELRTPLARMKFGMEMLGEATDEQDQRRHLEDMKIDVNELNSLVDELLSFAREDNHSIASELDILPPQQMQDWLQQQLDLAGRGHPTIELRLEFESATAVGFYAKSLARALSNGLQNAVRYADSEIVLSLITSDDNFVLRIDDDGPGIPAEVRKSIFEPFRRADGSRNRESGGFGLGLAIVKRIAETHRGSVHITDSPLGGNQLEFRWPVQTATNSNGKKHA